MDLDRIRELLKVVAESSVAEVEIEEGDFRLVVRKNATAVMVQAPTWPAYGGMNMPPPAYPPMAPMPAYPSQAPQAPSAAQAPPSAADVTPSVEAEAPAEEADEGTLVRAPIVGTFYTAPAPDADPFVEVGDEVQPGDVLCIIEAMKLMNEIECEVAGTIKKILAQNAEPVEYDQPLFVIETA